MKKYEREPFVIVIVGHKGTGKTTLGRTIADANKKKLVVLDISDHPSYRKYPVLNPDHLYRWKKGDIRIITGDAMENLVKIKDQVYNSTVLLEDAANYLDHYITRDVKPLFNQSKQKNNDIILMYHALSEVPKYLFAFTDRIVICKTLEDVATASKRFPNPKAVKQAALNVEAHPSKYYNEVVRLI